MSTFAERFRAAYERQGIKKADVARRLNITPQSVQKYETGGLPSRQNLLKLADALQVSAEYLLTGRTSVVETAQMSEVQTRRGGRVVPKLTALHAVRGNTDAVLGHYQTYFPCGPRAFLVEVWDDSNAPRYNLGDMLVIDPDKTPMPGRMVLAAVGADSDPALGRYVRRVNNGQTTDVVEHLNAVWGEHPIDGTASQIVGVVTERASSEER